jgi:hypothetical protein
MPGVGSICVIPFFMPGVGSLCVILIAMRCIGVYVPSFPPRLLLIDTNSGSKEG